MVFGLQKSLMLFLRPMRNIQNLQNSFWCYIAAIVEITRVLYHCLREPASRLSMSDLRHQVFTAGCQDAIEPKHLRTNKAWWLPAQQAVSQARPASASRRQIATDSFPWLRPLSGS